MRERGGNDAPPRGPSVEMGSVVVGGDSAPSRSSSLGVRSVVSGGGASTPSRASSRSSMPSMPSLPPLLRRTTTAWREMSLDVLTRESRHQPAMWATLALLVYFVVGTVFYTHVAGWSGLDAVYFLVVTLSTVGYGDLVPQTTGERVFTAFLVVTGVGIIGTFFGVVIAHLLDTQEERQAKKREQKALRHHAAQQANPDGGNRSREGGAAAMEEEEEEEEEDDERGQNISALRLSVVCIVVLIAVGTVVFWVVEDDLSWSDSFYMVCVTLTTVGYGDKSPHTTEGKWFSMLFVIAGTIMFGKALSELASFPLIARKRAMEQSVLQHYSRRLTQGALQELTSGQLMRSLSLSQVHPNSLTKAEFLLVMLAKMNKVALSDLHDFARTFDRLDRDHSGMLDIHDVVMWQRSGRQLNIVDASSEEGGEGGEAPNAVPLFNADDDAGPSRPGPSSPSAALASPSLPTDQPQQGDNAQGEAGKQVRFQDQRQVLHNPWGEQPQSQPQPPQQPQPVDDHASDNGDSDSQPEGLL